MNALVRCKASFNPYLMTLAVLLTLGVRTAGADDKKKAAPAAAPRSAPASAPAKSGAAAAHPGAAAASHGPTTANKGVTTANRGTSGPTTARPAGPSTTHPAGPSTTHPSAAGETAHTPTKTQTATNSPGARTPGATAKSASAPRNQTVARTKSGDEVKMRPGGKPATVHVASKGMEIHHGLNGSRHVEVVRADHTRIVAERGGRGYVQRPYSYGGREYGHRTYYYGGRYYDHYYHGYYYQGAYAYMYTPAYYYPPAFYGWAYNPWVAPVSYAWGWGGNPWYGYYGTYFSPYPVYPNASVWLTDYLLSATLAVAYEARAEGAAAHAQEQAEGAAALTPQVKDLIAAEVQRQIAVENAESQTAAQNAEPNPNLSGVQAMLADHVQHVFVAGRSLDVTDAAGTECAISEGDALQLAGTAQAEATTANLVVLSSKGGQECRAGTTVSVAVPDLQEMQNHMRETINQGMGDLKTKQAKGGLPAIPSSANGDTAKTPFAAAGPGPDQQAATLIAQQSQEADTAEKQVLSEVQQPASEAAGAPVQAAAASAGPPQEVSLVGQSIDEVTGLLGQPEKQVTVGSKRIYVYKDMNVTFNGGKVTDVKPH